MNPSPCRFLLPESVRHQRVGETTERSAHLEKLKQLFEAAPISRYLGMTLSYCENGVARVRLPFRAEFEERHGVIHGGLIGLLADTAGNFAVGSVSPGSTVKTVEFKMSLLAGVQGDLLAIGEVVRKRRSLATCRLEDIRQWGPCARKTRFDVHGSASVCCCFRCGSGPFVAPAVPIRGQRRWTGATPPFGPPGSAPGSIGMCTPMLPSKGGRSRPNYPCGKAEESMRNPEMRLSRDVRPEGGGADAD